VLSKGAAGLLILMPNVDNVQLKKVFNTFDVLQAQVRIVFDVLRCGSTDSVQ
jgi:hypothetical protein